jgi:2'-5' RNA ligase
MFAAVVPPPEAVEHLDDFLEVRRAAGPFRWAPADQLHLTLAFFADVPERKVDDLVERLGRAATRRTAFETAVTGGGAFPDVPRARVLWAGLDLVDLTRTEL